MFLNGFDNINQVNGAQDANQYLLHRVHSNGVTGNERSGSLRTQMPLVFSI